MLFRSLLKESAPEAFIPKKAFHCAFHRQLLTFGHLRHLWTMHFEVVHQYFKQLVKQTESFANVTASLNSRCRRRTVVNSDQRIATALSLPSSLRVVLLQLYDMCEASTVVSAKSVTVNGQKYKVGCLSVT